MATHSQKSAELDYSVSLILLVIYSLFIATAKEISAVLALPLFVQYILLKQDLKVLIQKLIKVNLFIGISALILLLEKKYSLASLVFVRGNLILWFTLSFNFNGFKLYKGLNNLKVSNKFSMLVFFTAKYIEILFSSALRLKELAMIRSFKGRVNRKTFQTYGDMFAFLLFLSSNKIERVKDVITLRAKESVLLPSRKVVFEGKELLLTVTIMGVIYVYHFA